MRRSKALRETGELLVDEQAQLSAFAEAIRARLHHFEELESIATAFHSVASSLDGADVQKGSGAIFDRFLEILKRLDACIQYVTTNPQLEISSIGPVECGIGMQSRCRMRHDFGNCMDAPLLEYYTE